MGAGRLTIGLTYDVGFAVSFGAARVREPVTAYGGAGGLLSGAARADIGLSVVEASSVGQFVEAGDLAPLLVLGDEASEVFPDVPTIGDVNRALAAPAPRVRDRCHHRCHPRGR